jgi:hypothetical protein
MEGRWKMTTADWALVISILSAVVSLASLGWSVWAKFIYPKPTVRVWFAVNRMIPDRAGVGRFLSLSATNHGPIKVILHYVTVRTKPDPKTKSRYGILNPLHDFPMRLDHSLGPFSGGLPKSLEVGETFSVYFPFGPRTFLGDDILKIGFRDTFGQHHWATTNDVQTVLTKYQKEFGMVPEQGADIGRDKDEQVPEMG